MGDRTQRFFIDRIRDQEEIPQWLEIHANKYSDRQVVHWQVFQECIYPNYIYLVVETGPRGKDLPLGGQKHD